MKHATVTLPDDLGRAVEAYVGDLEVSPALTAVTQIASREFLAAMGYLGEDDRGGTLVSSSGGKPIPLEDAPRIGGKTVAQIVLEDRR